MILNVENFINQRAKIMLTLRLNKYKLKSVRCVLVYYCNGSALPRFHNISRKWDRGKALRFSHIV